MSRNLDQDDLDAIWFLYSHFGQKLSACF